MAATISETAHYSDIYTFNRPIEQGEDIWINGWFHYGTPDIAWWEGRDVYYGASAFYTASMIGSPMTTSDQTITAVTIGLGSSHATTSWFHGAVLSGYQGGTGFTIEQSIGFSCSDDSLCLSYSLAPILFNFGLPAGLTLERQELALAQVATVPLPGALWLFLSGLMGLSLWRLKWK